LIRRTQKGKVMLTRKEKSQVYLLVYLLIFIDISGGIDENSD